MSNHGPIPPALAWPTVPRGIRWFGSIGSKRVVLPAFHDHPRREYNFEYVKVQRRDGRVSVRLIRVLEVLS